jgi:hypothetical protein
VSELLLFLSQIKIAANAGFTKPPGETDLRQFGKVLRLEHSTLWIFLTDAPAPTPQKRLSTFFIHFIHFSSSARPFFH